MNASRIGALVGLLLGVIAVCVGVWQAIVVLVLGLASPPSRGQFRLRDGPGRPPRHALGSAKGVSRWPPRTLLSGE